MKRHTGYLLATASGAAVAAAAGGAQAADMAVKAPPMAPVAAPSWAGWYIGLNAGANWQTSADSFGYAGGEPGGSFRTRATGFIGGGQIGYNWQNGSFVYGLEADISGLTGHGSVTGPLGFPVLDGKTFSNQIKWLSTVRARAGLAVGNNTMAYVTGGLAVGAVKNAFQGQQGPPDFFICCNKSVSSTRVGWTVGGGVEHMLNNHWTVALEGLFVDLGTSSATAIGLSGSTKTARFSNRAAIGRFKLNYKF
jgi:outer membrane immunogenic protein